MRQLYIHQDMKNIRSLESTHKKKPELLSGNSIIFHALQTSCMPHTCISMNVH